MKKVKIISIVVTVVALLVLLTGIYYSGIVEAWRPKKDVSVASLFAYTNEMRTQAGLKPLELNEDLNASASDKCNDMLEKKYWDHTSPDGTEPWDFIKVHTNYKEAGENLATDSYSSRKTVNMWMNSKTHRENILKNTYTDVGFGVCGKHVVQHFIAM